MAFNTQTVNHVNSFNVIDTVDGANEATREIFDGIATESLNRFEGFMIRNSFIASNDYAGGISETVSPSTVNQSNPAGTFRSLLTPKGDTMEMAAITSLGEVEFEKFGTDSISLAIDEYVRTPFKLLYAIDTGNGGKGWLVDQLESALSMQAISALVRKNNFKVYETIKQGAAVQTDNLRGTRGRILGNAAASPMEYTNELIEAIADYNALPEDRYVTGFEDEELVIAITKKAQAKLLEAKLVIYDGQAMGESGKFYQGLPYTHQFAGVSLFVTKFLNSADTQLPADYIITPIGRFAPFLFHLARFAGRAEVAPFTDGGLSVYGTMLSGMKVEEKLDQHITVKNSTTSEGYSALGFSGNLSELSAVKTEAGKVKLTGKTKAAAEYAVYDQQTGAQVVEPTAIAAGNINVTIEGLTAGKEYHILLAAGTIASPETKLGKQYLAHLYARA